MYPLFSAANPLLRPKSGTRHDRAIATVMLAAMTFISGANANSAEPSATETPQPEATSPLPESQRLVDQTAASEKDRAAALWSSAMEKFAERSFGESADLFRSYVDRHPSFPEAVDARYYMAQSYLYSKRPKEAVPAFISVIEIRGNSPLGNEARTHLGQAYLDDGRFTEAFLVSEEILSQNVVGNTLRAKALLLRAHAQAGMKQDAEAEKSLLAFQAAADADPELERELSGSYLVSLLLKANRCDAFPSRKTLPEDQLIDQISRKGLCILEMGTLLVKAAKRLDENELLSGSEALESSVKDLRKHCTDPSLEVPKKARAKLKQAKKEVRAKIAPECSSSEKLLLESWK
jgi:tetratricopeptide (TPR) repeat protein